MHPDLMTSHIQMDSEFLTLTQHSPLWAQGLCLQLPSYHLSWIFQKHLKLHNIWDLTTDLLETWACPSNPYLAQSSFGSASQRLENIFLASSFLSPLQIQSITTTCQLYFNIPLKFITFSSFISHLSYHYSPGQLH